jgi:hypothetical protein
MRAALLALLVTSSALAAEDMQPVESPVFPTTGTQVEIAKRGELCIARLVRFDGVSLRDATNSTSMLGAALDNPLAPAGKAQQVTGGNVIVTSAPESGVVVANNRLRFKMWALDSVVQSTLTLESKDGRFRLTHTAIQGASENTGISHNVGFKPLHPKTPIAKRAADELQKESAAIAECIQKPPSDW